MTLETSAIDVRQSRTFSSPSARSTRMPSSTAFELVHLREDLVYRKPKSASRLFEAGPVGTFLSPAGEGSGNKGGR